MLILSRRENEKIVFPNLQIEVSVVRVAGKIVRVGVNAPREVRILRGELVDDEPVSKPAAAVIDRHTLRNRLNKAMLGLQVLQASLETGQAADTEGLIFQIFQTLNEVNDSLDAPAGADASSGNAATASAADDRDSLRALIVDDSQNEATLLAQYLQLKGYTPHVVHNGCEAIRWLESHAQPDIVLMDMNMPEMDGPATVRAIRRDRRFQNLHLFGVSGLSPGEVDLETGSGGVDRWFQKPVDVREIVDEIGRFRSTAATAV
jgi:carbon storage regulator CsrA